MNKAMQLLAANRGVGTFKSKAITAAGGKNATAIYLYDSIVNSDAEAEMFGGVSAKAFAGMVNNARGDIHLHLNSPGGDVFAGRAMASALERYDRGTVIAYVDGLAASAASFVAMAAQRIEMAEGAFLMIHRAWTMAMGNASDLEESARLLRQIDESLVETYTKRTGQPREQIEAWLDAETWMSGAEAVQRGFADRADDKPREKSPWDLSAYSNAPDVLAADESEALLARLKLAHAMASV